MPRRKPEEAADASYPTWTSPIKPAPGDLRIVQAFVNTKDREKGTDELTSPRRLVEWLARWRLASIKTELAAADLERAVAVREALRGLIRTGGGTDVKASVLGPLNEASSRSGLFWHFEADGTARVEPLGEGLDGAFGRIFYTVAMAIRQNRFSRLKTCANPECRKIFYDFAPNRVGVWCTKKLCGNRINSRNFRRRHPGYYRDM